MKKLILVLVLAALTLTCLAQTHPYYFSESKTVPIGGSFVTTWTNHYPDAWMFSSFYYSLPALCTNEASISLVRTTETEQYQAHEVVTNFLNQVRTNDFLVVTNRLISTVTNTLFYWVSSNDTVIVADSGSIAGQFILNGDRLIFSFQTNTTYGFDAVK